jgi:hypothetical protein
LGFGGMTGGGRGALDSLPLLDILVTPENKIEDTERHDPAVLKLAKVLLARL